MSIIIIKDIEIIHEKMSNLKFAFNM